MAERDYMYFSEGAQSYYYGCSPSEELNREREEQKIEDIKREFKRKYGRYPTNKEFEKEMKKRK